MATLTGSSGSVTLGEGPGSELEIFAWTADLRRDLFPDDDFDDALNASKVTGGMADLVGTCTGKLKADKIPTIGTMATPLHGVGTAGFLLEGDQPNTKNYSFTGILTSVRTPVVKTQQTIVTVGFESAGAVAVNQ